MSSPAASPRGSSAPRDPRDRRADRAGGADDRDLQGAAGITGAGLVTVVASLQAFGGTFLTPEAIAVGIALVVGIDRGHVRGALSDDCVGNGVATIVVAKWVRERDDRRFQAALKDPSYVEEATERALHGEGLRPREEHERAGGRFEREPEPAREREREREPERDRSRVTT